MIDYYKNYDAYQLFVNNDKKHYQIVGKISKNKR